MKNVKSSKMLVSKFVPELEKENRLVRRASNIATLFLELMPKFEGKAVSVRALRLELLRRLDISPTNLVGDLRAHGDAYGKSGLGLETIVVGGQKYVEFSLVNQVRCIRYLLGQGRKVGALVHKQLVETVDDILPGDDVILSSLNGIEEDVLSDWELDFRTNVIRKGHLSEKQREKALEIMSEKGALIV